MKKLTKPLFALLLLMAMPAAQANLIVNGGFETGHFSGWTLSGNIYRTYESVVSSSDFTPHSGDYSAEFGPFGSLAYLSQSFTTQIGTTYNLDFWLANQGGTPNSFAVSVDNFASTLFSATDNPEAFGWTDYSKPFVATDTNTTLSFSFQQDPHYYYLDDVSVTGGSANVPEPGTMALFAIGMVAMGAFKRGNKAV